MGNSLPPQFFIALKFFTEISSARCQYTTCLPFHKKQVVQQWAKKG